MLLRPGRSMPQVVASALTLIIGAVALVGCGEDRLADDAYGFIDLSPYFYDGSTASNPTSGLPRTISVDRGWVNGVRAEYYDFGLIGVTKKRTSGGTPDYAQVWPMYFFFDGNRNPLFSKPIFETRTGLWHMRGGKEVLNPNPKVFSNSADETQQRATVYSIRRRDQLVDKKRGVADYQRPIIDRLNNNGDYAGLWEIYEVIVPDEYEPDSIKSLKTLQAGIDDGTYDVRRTQKVINCPVIDDRTYVTPTAMYYGVPHPRIELWYRTKQGSCFLADGWLTLGNQNGELYPAKSDSARLDTFDVLRYAVGSGEGQRITVVVPITKMYQPRIKVAGQGPSNVQLRFGNDWLSDTISPRRSLADPPGYTPIRWMWDLSVNQDPPYEAGAFRDVKAVDASLLAARNNVSNNESPWTRNMPLVGTAIGCKSDADCVDGNGSQIYTGPNNFGPLMCNTGPDLGLAANPVPAGTRDANGDGKVDVSDLTLLREGGPRCDLQAVGFGQFCAPGVARCMLSTAGTSEAKVQSNGKDVGGLLGGYVCIPSSGGYCYFRCDSDAMNTNTASAATMTLTYPGPAMQKLTKTASYPLDSRCGALPGFQCKNPASGPPSQARVCLRNCGAGDPDAFNALLCGKTVAVPMSISDKDSANFVFQDQDIMKGTVCKNTGLDNTAGCTWDPAYEPRDPKTTFVPGQ